MPCTGGECSVGLDRDLEPRRVQGLQQRSIELEERLSAGADHEPLAGLDCRATRPRPPPASASAVAEAAAARAVGAHEIGVAELADGLGPVALAAGPQVAAREAAEHRGPAGVGAFALEGVEDLLDRVGHISVSGKR